MNDLSHFATHAHAHCHWQTIAPQNRQTQVKTEQISGDFRAGFWHEVGDLVLPGLGQGKHSDQKVRIAGIDLTWQQYRSDKAMAWRITVHNTSTDAIALGDVSPVHFSAQTPGFAQAGWQALRQPRHKNDMPAVWDLADEGPAAWDAFQDLYECGSIHAVGDQELPQRMVSSELLGLSGPTGNYIVAPAPVHQQLCSAWLERGEQLGHLGAIGVDLHGDHKRINPGEEWSSQWVVLLSGQNLSALCEDYAELLCAWYPEMAERRDASPHLAVWCSWYYYGVSCRQEEVAEDLAAIAKAKLPIDVIQIDDCWDDHWGDWNAGTAWPDIATFASTITDAGYIPGIWTGGFLAEPRSSLANRHPDWLLKDRSGNYVRFGMSGMGCYVLDPTHPEALGYIERLYHRLTHDWGFTYHKIDFTRAVVPEDVCYHDPTCTKAEAYRRGLNAIRRGMGPDAYLNICGGLYGPSIGLADAQRTGADVHSTWPRSPETGTGSQAVPYGPFTIKQNTMRWWMNRLWANDGDALMLRRNDQPYVLGHLSLGQLNDDEALTCSLNQYLAGGMTCVSERMASLDDDRLALWRHCIPAHGQAAKPLDLHNQDRFPALFQTQHKGATGAWETLSVINWYPEPRTIRRRLADLLPHLSGQVWIGAFRAGWQRLITAETDIVIELPAHGCEVVRIQAVDPSRPQLVATNGHFSMGHEITQWNWDGKTLEVAAEWTWTQPLRFWISTFNNDKPLIQEHCLTQSETIHIPL